MATVAVERAGTPLRGKIGAERGGSDLVAREGVEEPRCPHYAGERAAEGADGCADGYKLADPTGDEPAAEVTEQRARRDEVLDALCVCPEAHHLDGRDEVEIEAAEDGDAEDRTRYVAARLLRPLAQGRRGLEPGEEEEPENHPEKHGRKARSCGYREHREVEGVAVRGRTGSQPDQNDDAHDEYERDGRPLDDEEDPRASPDVRGR